jgi:uncharacterized protein
MLRLKTLGFVILWMCGSFGLTHVRGQSSPIFDHHIHVLSPRLIADWKSLGMEFSRADEAYSDSTEILSKTVVSGAFLISMSHLYTTEEFQSVCKTLDMERRLVAAENDYVGVSVAREPERFVGFFSVNPLRDYAFDELNRCKTNPNLTGLKLHLPSCGLTLENEHHFSRLERVLAFAATNDVPVLLHLTAGEEVSVEKAIRFWESVILPHANLELYLAHLGSVGGFNSNSENILKGFSHVASKSPEFERMQIYFDLSGAIMTADANEGVPTTEDMCKRLSVQISQIGVERFLFASDYPVFSVAETQSNLTTRLFLSEKDSTQLLKNRSPRFARLTTQDTKPEQSDKRDAK